MTLRLVVSLFLVAAGFALLGGCHGSPTAAPTPVTTGVTAQPGATSIPTLSPNTASPVPQATAPPYQPLANGDTWSYSCTPSGTATKAVTTGSRIGGIATFSDTLNLSTLPVSVTAIEGLDGLGNTLLYGWVVGNSTSSFSSAQLEYSINPSTGQSWTYPGPVIGTITTTYEGSQGSLMVPAGTYSNVALFKSVNSQPIFPALGEVDFYTVAGVGPIQLGFPDNTPALTCALTSPPTLH